MDTICTMYQSRLQGHTFIASFIFFQKQSEFNEFLYSTQNLMFAY